MQPEIEPETKLVNETINRHGTTYELSDGSLWIARKCTGGIYIDFRRSVKCPVKYCNSNPGRACISKVGHVRQYIHQERMDAAKNHPFYRMHHTFEEI